MSEINLVQAVNLALQRAITDDPGVIVLGEDVGIDGGVFRATDGLFKLHGGNRVIDTPLAEVGIAGASIGLAAQGFRPVAEIQFTGFAYACIDQILNHAARCAPARADGSPARWCCARQQAAASAPSSIIRRARNPCSRIFRGSRS